MTMTHPPRGITGEHTAAGDVDEDRCVADATQRLSAEFGARVEPGRISAVVLACRRDLHGAPAAALPELVERLARQRLL